MNELVEEDQHAEAVQKSASGLQERARQFGVTIPDEMALRAGKILVKRDSGQTSQDDSREREAA